MPFELINLSEESVVAEIHSPEFSTSYPDIINRETIPASALAAMECTWNVGRFDRRRVKIYELRNVYVAGEGIVFDNDRRVISQLLTQQVPEHIRRAAEELAAGLRNNDVESIAKPTILGVKPGWQNYGHWLIEILPMADLANRTICNKLLQFLFAYAPGSKMEAVIAQSASAIGISPEKFIRYQMKPMFFETLFCVTGLTHHGVYMSPLVFSPLSRISDSVTAASSETLIYIKRGANMHRTFVNEAEVDELFRSKGYRIICPEDWTLSEQISFCRGAKKVFGVAGAAMTNIAFCDSGTDVTTFYPETMPDCFFWFIAEHRRLNFVDYRCPLVGDSKTHNSWDKNLYIEPADLLQLL